jgi:hypothetical protein
MGAEARCFKSPADETRLKSLWLLSVTEKLCVGDVIDVPGVIHSQAAFLKP